MSVSTVLPESWRSARRPVAAVAAGILAVAAFVAAGPPLFTANATSGSFSPPASPPVSPPSSPPEVVDVEIKNKPRILARGLGAEIRLRFQCPPGSEFVDVTAEVTQRVGQQLATGFAVEEVHCTGERQRVSLTVVRDPGGAFFVRREALIEARISGLDSDGFFFSDVDREIRRLQR